MYLSKLFAENFRVFGSKEDGKQLDLEFTAGLNALVGENDAGKTAIIDALRLVLWTTGNEYNRLTEDDFHVTAGTRRSSLSLCCRFSGLTTQDAGRFLEWISTENGQPTLYVWLKASLSEKPTGPRGSRVMSVCRSGSEGEGRAIEGDIREFLRATYLRPLRDAESELSSGRNSRLSQILQAHPTFEAEKENDFDEAQPAMVPQRLVGIMRQAEHRIQHNKVITDSADTLNTNYLSNFAIASDALVSQIGVGNKSDLRQILEKLDLGIQPSPEQGLPTRRGLGTNNVLFMATELLLLGGGSEGEMPLLLIEEPEAHLHPQMQLRMIDFLRSKADTGSVQVILSTHSPNLASKINLVALSLVSKGRAYPLRSELTALAPGDYRFLERFLDVTRGNLFFAKGVLIVEGDAENILLPAIAAKMGKDLSKHGVSIVNVGHVGLFRYARIFQRKDGSVLPVRVACLADRDIPPDEANGYVPRRKDRAGTEIPTYESEVPAEEKSAREARRTRYQGGCVQARVSDHWTFEYDLAVSGLGMELQAAIEMARSISEKDSTPTDDEAKAFLIAAKTTCDEWGRQGLTSNAIAAGIYEPLWRKQVSKAETAQCMARLIEMSPFSAEELAAKLPRYIVESLAYVTAIGGGGA